jgi:hypothetical protein
MVTEHGAGRAAEPAEGQIHPLRRPLTGGVRRRRGSEPWPGRPARRPVRARAPAGAREACLAGAGRARPAPVDDDLAPGDLGAVDGHERHHHLGVGQDPGGSVGLEGHRAQGGGEWAAAMPQPPAGVEPKSAAVLLGLDHEHPTGPITRWSRLARLPWTARSCRTAHPCRSSGESRRAVRRSPAAPRRPSDGVWAGLEPQPPASCHGRERANHQAEPEYQQAAKDSPPTPTVVAIRQARVRVHAAHPAARNRRHLPPGRRRPGGRRWLVPAPPPPGLCRREATAASC